MRYWAGQAVELCRDIDDESLEEYAQPVRQALETLERDRRVIVIGGEKCGKSSLLAGVAGCPLMARVPLTRHYVCWRYRSQDGDATCSRFLPESSLEGLELVDTRSCADAEVAETVKILLQGADVVLAVVDGRSPEQSPIWDILKTLPEKSVGACLLAVTFTDTLSAEVALQLKDSMRELCRNRLGTNLPQYFISPGSESGMDIFAERVQEALEAPGGLRSTLRHVLERSVDLVRKQGRVLNSRAAVARTDSGFLAGIEQEIDNFLSHQLVSLKQRADSYSAAATRTLPRLLQRFRRTFGWFLSPVTLLRLELMGTGTEKCFYRLLCEEVLRLQQESDRQFVLSCAGHWKSVRPRMKKTLECEIGEFPAEELESELEQLRTRLGRELYEPFARLRLRHHLSTLFNAQAAWMQVCIAFICLFLFIAGILGFIGQDTLGMSSVGVALVLWLGGSVAHLTARSRLRKGLVEKGEELQQAMAETLSTSVERLVISRVAAYRRLYTAPRRKVAQHEAMLEPLQKRYSTINIQLSAISPRL